MLPTPEMKQRAVAAYSARCESEAKDHCYSVAMDDALVAALDGYELVKASSGDAERLATLEARIDEDTETMRQAMDRDDAQQARIVELERMLDAITGDPGEDDGRPAAGNATYRSAVSNALHALSELNNVQRRRVLGALLVLYPRAREVTRG